MTNKYTLFGLLAILFWSCLLAMTRMVAESFVRRRRRIALQRELATIGAGFRRAQAAQFFLALFADWRRSVCQLRNFTRFVIGFCRQPHAIDPSFYRQLFVACVDCALCCLGSEKAQLAIVSCCFACVYGGGLDGGRRAGLVTKHDCAKRHG